MVEPPWTAAPAFTSASSGPGRRLDVQAPVLPEAVVLGVEDGFDQDRAKSGPTSPAGGTEKTASVAMTDPLAA